MSGMNKPNTDNKPDQQEKRKKESILELSKFLEKSIRVKFAGGREASGVLKGKLILNWIPKKRLLVSVHIEWDMGFAETALNKPFWYLIFN